MFICSTRQTSASCPRRLRRRWRQRDIQARNSGKRISRKFLRCLSRKRSVAMIFFCSTLRLSTILFGIVAPNSGSAKCFNIVQQYYSILLKTMKNIAHTTLLHPFFPHSGKTCNFWPCIKRTQNYPNDPRKNSTCRTNAPLHY